MIDRTSTRERLRGWMPVVTSSGCSAAEERTSRIRSPDGARDAMTGMTDTILWRRLDVPGHEAGRLVHGEDGVELSGTAVFAHEQRACTLDYVVVCDSGWRTKSVRVSGWIGDAAVDLHATADEDRRWRLNGADRPVVAGCMDVDLGFSPATNLLPIRRLSLGLGEEAEVSAAWLPFPSLAFEVLPQVYRRLGETTYRYESHGGAFARTLEVNAAGFVVSYPGLWQAESAF